MDQAQKEAIIRGSIFGLIVLVVLVVGVSIWAYRFAECRSAGFSVFYCLT